MTSCGRLRRSSLVYVPSTPAPAPSRPRGLFIVLEGIDGSGTTSQGTSLTERIRGLNEDVIFTYEPSAGPAGALIRLALARRLVGPSGLYPNRQLGDPISTSLDSATFALLFAADRMDHVETLIRPALAKGYHVVCDRYILSSLAYQGLDLDPQWLMVINKNAPKPDLTILLDLPVKEARQRMTGTRWAKDLFEEDEKLEMVREQYKKMLTRFSAMLGPSMIIDASNKFFRVDGKIWEHIEPLLIGGRTPTAGRSKVR